MSLNCYESVACFSPLNMADRLSDWPIYSPDVNRFCPDIAVSSRIGALPWTYSIPLIVLPPCHISEWIESIIVTFLCYLL